ncbi:hypothetical protein ZWY2020_000763 [Hordeum vulgare]|nr:hypothetical protein ZWY2020_000763 [Hordeum vulgare]
MESTATGEETVRLSHKGSRVIFTTTRADVAVRLGELRDQILAGHVSVGLDVLRDQMLAGRASFADLAVQHSECSSARRGGDQRL